MQVYSEVQSFYPGSLFLSSCRFLYLTFHSKSPSSVSVITYTDMFTYSELNTVLSKNNGDSNISKNNNNNVIVILLLLLQILLIIMIVTTLLRWW